MAFEKCFTTIELLSVLILKGSSASLRVSLLCVEVIIRLVATSDQASLSVQNDSVPFRDNKFASDPQTCPLSPFG